MTRFHALCAAIGSLILGTSTASAQVHDFAVEVRINQINGRESEDYYPVFTIEGEPHRSKAVSNKQNFRPSNWFFRKGLFGGTFDGGNTVQVEIRLMAEDGWLTGDDDHFDINPAADAMDMDMRLAFDRATNQGRLLNAAGDVLSELSADGEGRFVTAEVVTNGNRNQRATVRFQVVLVRQPDFVIRDVVTRSDGRIEVVVENVGAPGILTRVERSGDGSATSRTVNVRVESGGVRRVTVSGNLTRRSVIGVVGTDLFGAPETNIANNTFRLR